MCGITGFLEKNQKNEPLKDVIDKMTDSMQHRGPDDRGTEVFIDDQLLVALGQRRLSILDLSEKGHQPMWNKRKDIGVVFNGEIYNFIELREELRKKGHDFDSDCDTEVLIEAYDEWGTECFQYFNGMWGMAIYDKRKKKLILSRDRYGQKPLYYYKNGDVFVYGSEIKSLLAHPSVPCKPNVEKIFRYLSTNYRYVDIDDYSYFDGIRQVNKSSVMEVDYDLGSKEYPYWKLEVNEKYTDMTDERAVEEFRELFTDAVRLRLRSDVPVGCFLSGGLDSTSITSTAYKLLKQPIITFSGVTGEKKGVYDESEYIDAVIESTNANAHYLRPEPADIFSTVDEMMKYHDEPICTVTWYSIYLISKMVKGENIPVILNGHGGDELLAGYWDHYQYYFYELSKNGDKDTYEYEVGKWYENHKRDMGEIERTSKYIDGMLSGAVSEMSRFPDYADCFTEEIQSKYKRNIVLENPAHSLVDRRLYSDLFYEAIPASLRAEDRNTMSQSLESRSPFLDYRLAEYAFKLPTKFKIRDGVGKWLLRESMKGILPEKVRTRKDKAGFIAPADEWFRTINKQQILDLINSEGLREIGIFNTDRIMQVFQEHVNKEKNHYMFIWQLINIHFWYKRFFTK